MSLPLVDCRCKLTHEAHAVLESQSRVGGHDRSESIREVMHKWAIQKINEASLLDSLLKREGLGSVAEGIAGSVRDCEGLAGKPTVAGTQK